MNVEIMTTHPIKIILALVMSNCMISCVGQVKPNPKLEKVERLKIGREVSKIDDQIWAIFQDSKGNHWFGSNGNGVYHYDGKALKQITTNDGLMDNTIRGIQEDSEGNIYIETPKGVSKYDGTKFSNLEVVKSPDNQWILETTDLWFNCNGNANHVYRYDGEKMYELQLPEKNIKEVLGIDDKGLSYSPYTVFGIDKDRSGNLWLGTVLAGAFRFDGKSFLWVGEKELSRLPDGREPGVRSILEDNDGNFWLSNFISKYTLDPNSTKQYEKHNAQESSRGILKDRLPYFNSGIVDKNGNLWMTAYGDGVWKYDGATLSNIEVYNGTEAVLLICIYEDQDGTIWLGTDNDGVYKKNGANFEKYTPKIE